MEVYKPNSEPRPCACGGRCAWTPSIKAKHEATKKHLSWRWRSLCEAMLAEGLTLPDKIRILRESKTLVALV